MDAILQKIRLSIDRLNTGVGHFASWFSGILVVLVCVNVVMRYIFNVSFKWENELEWHFFSVIFLLGGAYTLLENKHVRVDVFFSKFSPKDKAITELIGTIVFLLPWSALITYYSFLYFWDSFQLGEGSTDPGGLSAWYWIKFVIPLGFSLLFLQGVSTLIRAYLSLKNNDFSAFDSHESKKIS